MAFSSEEDKFLDVVVAAIPKIAELIAAMPAEDRAGALEVAERRFLQTAEDFGCAKSASQEWATAVTRILRDRVKEQEAGKQKLKGLYEELSGETFGHAQTTTREITEGGNAASSGQGSKLLQAIRALLKMAFQDDDPGQR
jgi:hypothetical protein